MAKALFDGHCGRCDRFKPRCAWAWIQARNLPPEVRPNVVGLNVSGRTRCAWILCEGCRRDMRGLYWLDPRHKGASR